MKWVRTLLGDVVQLNLQRNDGDGWRTVGQFNDVETRARTLTRYRLRVRRIRR